MSEPKWKHDGVRVIPGDSLDPNTAQTPGMDRKAAVNCARVGAQKIWAGTVRINPNAKTGAHHHGELESVIYVVRGRARMRWGERLEFVAEASPGDFIYVPPFVPHQEINASPDEPLECVLVRSDNEAVVVNIPHIYSAEQVPRGKPEPDLFLHAARAVGADPACCLVIEDSANGVKAARAAGMRVWGFLGGGHLKNATGDELLDAGAERNLKDWEHATPMLSAL